MITLHDLLDNFCCIDPYTDYLCLMQPSWLHTIDDIKHKIDGIIATDKKIREHDEYYVGSLRNDIISYELVQRV